MERFQIGLFRHQRARTPPTPTATDESLITVHTFLPELLRASHAKPWSDCASDSERLDVFNGFLLSAQLPGQVDRCLC
jgi:hypothetical protein